jgi:hypothetical protein
MNAKNARAIIAEIVFQQTAFGRLESHAYAQGVQDALRDDHGSTNPFADMEEAEIEEMAERLARL